MTFRKALIFGLENGGRRQEVVGDGWHDVRSGSTWNPNLGLDLGSDVERHRGRSGADSW